MSTQPTAIHPEARIGHVHLKVADLDRAIAFYHDVLGFELMQRYGRQAAFLSAGGYHHHIGANSWQSAGAEKREAGRTGLNWIEMWSAHANAPESREDPWGTVIRTVPGHA